MRGVSHCQRSFHPADFPSPFFWLSHSESQLHFCIAHGGARKATSSTLTQRPVSRTVFPSQCSVCDVVLRPFRALMDVWVFAGQDSQQPGSALSMLAQKPSQPGLVDPAAIINLSGSDDEEDNEPPLSGAHSVAACQPVDLTNQSDDPKRPQVGLPFPCTPSYLCSPMLDMASSTMPPSAMHL